MSNAEYFQFVETRLLAKFGFVPFLVGSLFWILAMGFRLSIAPWAAQTLVETFSLLASEAISGGLIPGMALVVPLLLGMSPLPDLTLNEQQCKLE